MRRGYKILQDRWSSFQIILDPEFITRKQLGISDIAIGREQVERIQETRAGIFVRTTQKDRFIHLPTGLDDYDDAKMGLQQWRDIEQVSPIKNYHSMLAFIQVFLLAVSFGVLFLSKNVGLVVLAGISIIFFIVWGQINWRRNPQIDGRVKSGSRQIVLFTLVIELLR